MPALPSSMHTTHPARPSGLHIIRVLSDMITGVRRRRRAAIAIAHLEGLPDYLLADIGLTRDRVSAVIGDPRPVRWQGPRNFG